MAMDSDEISKLCSNPNLDEANGPIGNKSASREDLEGAMNVAWRVPYKVKVEQIGTNIIFKFYFGNIEDHQYVWIGGPWVFDKQLISLVKPVEIGNIDRIDFSRLSIWIRTHNASVTSMNVICASFWVTIIGILKKVEVKVANMRVRVRIVVNESLQGELGSSWLT
ncbi:hypothetical protein TorRG33x02_272070 [Trema orientale]|uniref:DUF4283 domain-containing protein n=1 Tax=Trema orientale TaxID=63057 RepID=A0A2P5CVC6_TREOI|nr:hypothetical protein TorRG33x02_272070 [Trema orientale]